MSGRGDNNKHGSAGQGARNQSNQPFIADGENQPRSDHDKAASTPEASIEQQPSRSAGAHRDTGAANASARSVKTTQPRNFNLVVDDVPYVVSAKPFSFNDEIRYEVKVNSGETHVFTWDSELKMLRAIDDDSATLPEGVEEEISRRLQSKE